MTGDVFRVSRAWLWSAGFLGMSYIAVSAMAALRWERPLGAFGAMFFGAIAVLWLFLLVHLRRHPLLSLDDKGLTISGVWSSRRHVRWADIQGLKDGYDGAVLETTFGVLHLPVGWLSKADRSRVVGCLQRTLSRGHWAE